MISTHWVNNSYCWSDVGGQHCPCPVCVRISGNPYPVSAVLILPKIIGPKRRISRNRGHERGHVKCRDRGHGQEISVRCLSVRILSVSILFAVQILSVICLSDLTKTRQRCPDFRCPCPPTSAVDENFRSDQVISTDKKALEWPWHKTLMSILIGALRGYRG